MQPGRTGKSVYDTLCNLNNQGFRTSLSKAYEFSWLYDINIDSYVERGGYVRPELNVNQRLCLSSDLYNNVIWTSWRLKSPANGMLV